MSPSHLSFYSLSLNLPLAHALPPIMCTHLLLLIGYKCVVVLFFHLLNLKVCLCRVNQHETFFTTHFGVDFTNKQLGYMLKIGHCITMRKSQ